MSDERRRLDDDAQLADLLRRYTDVGLRPFDPSSIAASAIAAGPARRDASWWRLLLTPRDGRRASLLVALGLLLLGAGVMALVGAATWLEPRPLAGGIAVWGYGGGRGEAAVDEIRVIDPNGSGERVLPSTGHDSYPVWSPDGTRIAYTAHDNRAPVRVADADGTGAHSITEGYSSGEPVAWSPDGRQIAFIGSRYPGGTDDGLHVVNADGSGLVRLVGAVQRTLTRLAWSPDGSLISYVEVGPGTSDGDGEAVLQVVDPRTGTVARVSAASLVWQGDYGAPSWSPDGSRLLYAVEVPGDPVFDPRERIERAPSGIAVAERGPAGWTERLIVSDPIDKADISPVWLDADRFVFLRAAGTRLVLADANGSGQRVLVQEDVLLRSAPCVAPDGSGVAVALHQEEGAMRGELLVVAVDGGGPPRRIPTGHIWGEGPGCSWQAVKP